MIEFHAVRDGTLRRVVDPGADAPPEGTLWVDLLDPTPAEAARAGRLLGFPLPTRGDAAARRRRAAEAEEPVRLYEERGVLFLTALVITGVGARRPVSSEVTFVLTPEILVTLRRADFLAFRTFEAKCQRQPEAHGSSRAVFLSLVDNIVNRIADVLEATEAELDALSVEVFADEGGAGARRPSRKPRRARADLRMAVKRFGRFSSLVAKLRQSLLSVARILAYFGQAQAGGLARGDMEDRLGALDRDVQSLTDYDAQLAAEIGFLLEATLGLINIEQNHAIRVYSVVSVLFLPPTLVGTIYGMNFARMPELGWALGYPAALLLMALSAAAAYVWFRRQGWL